MGTESDDREVARFRAVATERLYSEAFWLAAALVTAVIVGATTIWAAILSFFAFEPQQLNANVDVIYKLGLIGVGVVTFCTVVWRGLITSRQADAQRDQLEKLSEQIAATETTNRANLFHKGAEFLAEEDKPARVAAGIAMLSAVGRARDPLFSVQVLDLLADFVQAKGPPAWRDNLGLSAMDALEQVSAICGQTSSRVLEFSLPEADRDWLEARNIFLRLLIGPKRSLYSHMRFNFVDVNEFTAGQTDQVFAHCLFLGGSFDFTYGNFRECEFHQSRVHVYGRGPGLKGEFYKCDFSGCRFDYHPETLSDFSLNENYFDPDNPPICTVSDRQFDWSRKFVVSRPPVG